MEERFKLRKNIINANISFIHEDKGDHSSAFDLSEDIVILLRLPYNAGASGATLCIYDTHCVTIIEKIGTLQYSERRFDEYVFKIPKNSLKRGLYFGCIYIMIFGKAYKSNGSYDDVFFDLSEDLNKNFQITITDFNCHLSKPKISGIIYHIFVDRFARPKGDRLDLGKNNGLCWDNIPEFPEYPGAPIKNDSFFGGDLTGITQKLDYIKSLGVSLIYLSPIFQSPSNHRYDTSDYMTVDPRLGGESALASLIESAKHKGIEIILDGVFNHTGSDSIYFNKEGNFDSLGAYQSKSSPYFGWYSFKEFPDEYECWWEIPILPRINPDIPSCRSFFVGTGGVIEKYMSLGIKGFRLDVADELSDDFISSIKKKLLSFGDKLLFGEVWEDASNKIAYNKLKKYYLGDELDGVMNYPLRAGLIEYAVYSKTEGLKYALTDILLNAPKRISYNQMNLLGSHDTVRILTALGDYEFEGTNEEKRTRRLTNKQKTNAIKLLKALYTVLISLPGIPTVYYGDEAGIEGFSDPFNRMPYPWGRENRSLLYFYKKCGKIRVQNEILRDGDFNLLRLNGDLLIFKREFQGEILLTVFNNCDKKIIISADNDFKALISNKTTESFVLKGRSAEIFSLKKTKKFKIQR